jgi:hypothetical protein
VLPAVEPALVGSVDASVGSTAVAAAVAAEDSAVAPVSDVAPPHAANAALAASPAMAVAVRCLLNIVQVLHAPASLRSRRALEVVRLASCRPWISTSNR